VTWIQVELQVELEIQIPTANHFSVKNLYEIFFCVLKNFLKIFLKIFFRCATILFYYEKIKLIFELQSD